MMLQGTGSGILRIYCHKIPIWLLLADLGFDQGCHLQHAGLIMIGHARTVAEAESGGSILHEPAIMWRPGPQIMRHGRFLHVSELMSGHIAAGCGL